MYGSWRGSMNPFRKSRLWISMEQHRVQKVLPLPDQKLEITFDDSAVLEFDMRPLLQHKIFQPLQDPAAFIQVSVDPVSGNVCWPNGADLDTQRLYYSDMLGQSLDPLANSKER